MPDKILVRSFREVIRDSTLPISPVRSPSWKTLRDKFILDNPVCAACGQSDNLSVHHKLPFHIYPHLELELWNLITLCENGPADMNCHLLVGHGGNWADYNPNVEASATMISLMISSRVRSNSQSPPLLQT